MISGLLADLFWGQSLGFNLLLFAVIGYLNGIDVYKRQGLTWPHAKLGILMSLEYLAREGLITLS